MHWYLVHTKPRQEKCALQNLEQQGYECYLPILPVEKIRQGGIAVAAEALFPRYLFIRLGQDLSSKSWGPIRSTKGVSRLVSFGAEPAKVDERLIGILKAQEEEQKTEPRRLFNAGDRVRLTNGPFAGIEGVYQMQDGQLRVIMLIEILSKLVTLRVNPSQLLKVVG